MCESRLCVRPNTLRVRRFHSRLRLPSCRRGLRFSIYRTTCACNLSLMIVCSARRTLKCMRYRLEAYLLHPQYNQVGFIEPNRAEQCHICLAGGGLPHIPRDHCHINKLRPFLRSHIRGQPLMSKPRPFWRTPFLTLISSVEERVRLFARIRLRLAEASSSSSASAPGRLGDCFSGGHVDYEISTACWHGLPLSPLRLSSFSGFSFLLLMNGLSSASSRALLVLRVAGPRRLREGTTPLTASTRSRAHSSPK